VSEETHDPARYGPAQCHDKVYRKTDIYSSGKYGDLSKQSFFINRLQWHHGSSSHLRFLAKPPPTQAAGCSVSPVIGMHRGVCDYEWLRSSNDLWFLQPHFTPKYHCPGPVFNNLALFETPIYAA
jgi:hypothetical protein